MNLNLQRITAALLLGSYTLAVTVSGVFHTHRAPVWDSCAPDRSEHQHESPCHTHAHHAPSDHHVHNGPFVPEVAESDPSRTVAQGNVCAVCSFLAQKLMPVAAPDEVTCTYMARAMICPKAVARIEEPLSHIWSRGPPSLA